MLPDLVLSSSPNIIVQEEAFLIAPADIHHPILVAIVLYCLVVVAVRLHPFMLALPVWMVT